ncbi:MAG: GNAT family N-acetyltransferase [Candidatus Heimdallarchaeota archaeon]|nr:GNAT family N-acetyltransferase [Candidatus Heimdallarchaeota archaeon]
MYIRDLEERDIPQTAKLIAEAFSVYGDPVTDVSVSLLQDYIRNIIKFNLGHPLVAEMDNRIVGSGMLRFYPEVAWVASMTTLPEYQQMGVGDAILRKLLEIATNSGYNTLELWGSIMGERLYSRHGFISQEYRAATYTIMDSISVSNEATIMDDIPDWALKLDREAHGADRSSYLDYLIQTGSKVILIENEGFGLTKGTRMGTIIAKEVATAVKIIIKAKEIGIHNCILPSHQLDALSNHLQLKKSKQDNNLKMIRGQVTVRNKSFLFGIDSYGAG